MADSPVSYRPDIDQIQPDERETVRQLNSAFDLILERTAEDHGHAVRSVHAKPHGVLKGELTVDAGLPAELAQGLFAVPGTYPVSMRLSTNAGDILPDAISLPRGLAMKVFDAPAAANSLGGAPNVEPLGETYYSVTAFRYGDYIAKFSLKPGGAPRGSSQRPS